MTMSAHLFIAKQNLTLLRSRWRSLLSLKPMISGWPCFDAKKHIESMNEWLAEKAELEKEIEHLESIYEPEVKIKELADARRKRIWMEKHYNF